MAALGTPTCPVWGLLETIQPAPVFGVTSHNPPTGCALGGQSCRQGKGVGCPMAWLGSFPSSILGEGSGWANTSTMFFYCWGVGERA